MNEEAVNDEAATEEPGSEDAETPLLRIVRGNPTPEEIAALTAVVSALASAPTDEPAPPRSEWAAPYRRLRATHRPGPGAWRASAR